MSDTIDGVRIVDMPDLGAITDSSSFVGEHAGSGRFMATALQSYLLGSSRYIFVRQYGALGNGSTDDTAAINAAFAAVPAAGGVVVFDPALTYAITSHLTLLRSNVVIQGNGATIISSHATDDILQLGTASATLSELTVKDLSFWASVVKTGGAAVRALGQLFNSTLENVKLGSFELYQAAGAAHRLWNGLDLTAGFARVLVDNASEVITANHGVRAAGGGSATAAELQLDQRTLFCTWGVYVGGSANVYVNGEISQCREGVHVDTAITGTTNREVFFQQGAVIDSCTDYSVHFTAGSVALVDAHSAWFTSAGQLAAGQGVGIYFEPNAGNTPYCNAIFSGIRLYNNKAAGIVNGGATMLLSASTIDGNANGVQLTGDGARSSAITGNLFIGNTGTALQVAGVTAYSVESNNFATNGTQVAGAAWSSTQSVRNNLGFQTANSGASAIPAGTNPTVVVTHGLPTTPICITLGDSTNTFPVAVIATSATTFTIQALGTLSGPLAAYWRADMGTNS